MRILKTVEFYYPFQEMGGPVVKVREIAAGLSKMGHSVTVLTPDWGFSPERAPDMRANRWQSGWRAEEQGVETIFLPVWFRYRALAFAPGALHFAAKRLCNYDAVHCYGIYDFLGPTAAFVCRRRHIPYYIEPMGMYTPILRNLRLKRLYHRLTSRNFLAGARAIIVTSEQERAEIAASGIDPSRILLRRNGVRAPSHMPEKGAFRKRWGLPLDAKLVLFLGRVVPKKNPELLIQAFAEWFRQSGVATPAFLIIAGPAETEMYAAQLKKLAVSLGVEKSVLFTGPLYDAEKWQAYQDADVFVLPSQNENFGNSAAEAIACGTPVILSEHCGISSVVRGRAGIVVPLDRGALATALGDLLGSAEPRTQFQNGCASVARELSWEEPISQMEQIYRSAVTHQTRRTDPLASRPF